MPISQAFLYLQENNKKNIFLMLHHFKDAKNHRNRLNHPCRKKRFKNITNGHVNIGPGHLKTVYYCELKKGLVKHKNFQYVKKITVLCKKKN